MILYNTYLKNTPARERPIFLIRWFTLNEVNMNIPRLRFFVLLPWYLSDLGVSLIVSIAIVLTLYKHGNRVRSNLDKCTIHHTNVKYRRRKHRWELHLMKRQ